MIKGVHAMFYSREAEAIRSFFKEKLQLPCYDVGGGWLIFDFKEADMGVHPTDEIEGPPSGTHNISFYCDNIEKTVADLKKRGVTFTDEITDRGFSKAINFSLPGGGVVLLYEPRYKSTRPQKAEGRKKPVKVSKKSAAKKSAKKKKAIRK